jgi:hypothetical protein
MKSIYTKKSTKDIEQLPKYSINNFDQALSDSKILINVFKLKMKYNQYFKLENEKSI